MLYWKPDHTRLAVGLIFFVSTFFSAVNLLTDCWATLILKHRKDVIRFDEMKGVLALLGIYFVRSPTSNFFFRHINPTNYYFYSKALNKVPKADQSTFPNGENQKQKDSLSVLLTENVIRKMISLFLQDLDFMEYLFHQKSCGIKAKRSSSEKKQELAGLICCTHRICYFRICYFSRPFARLRIVFPLKTLKGKHLPLFS